jgi:hypothetical protein
MTYSAATLTTLCVLVLPLATQAWTDAQVTSVAAQLDVTSPERARVDLEVGVHVGAGWLSSFELLDLDPGLELLPDSPPEFSGADGRGYAPVVSVGPAGSVSLSFPDRTGAPRHGDYLLRFAYATRQWDRTPSNSGPQPSSWSLPRWPDRVPNASIRVLAPPGSRSSSPREEVDQVEVRSASDAVEMLYQRVELPRTQAFVVRFELPRPAPPAAPRIQLERLPRPDPSALWLGLTLAIVWIAKRQLVQSAGLAVEPLWRLPGHAAAPSSGRRALYTGCGALLCAGAVIGFEQHPILAALSGTLGNLSLLEIVRRPAAPSDAAPAASGFEAARLLDATTLTGGAACLVCYAVLAVLYPRAPAAVSCVALQAAPLFLSAARTARGTTRDGSCSRAA